MGNLYFYIINILVPEISELIIVLLRFRDIINYRLIVKVFLPPRLENISKNRVNKLIIY